MKIPVKYLGIGIIIFHLIGVVGTLWPVTRALTVSLTPLNLVLSSVLLLASQQDINRSWIIVAIVVTVAGYFIEVVGVQTGVLFGVYEYGGTLGLSWLAVPLVMGLNWFLLVVLFGQLVAPYPINMVLKAVLSALGMALLDVLIEPVAISLDYWSWSLSEVPLQNYLAWFFIGFFMQLLFIKVNGTRRSLFVFYLLAAQLMYFSMILLFL